MDEADNRRIGGHSQRVYQAAKVRRGGWTKPRRETFLAVLAETCNVQAAARAAGPSVSSAYKLRKADPAFADLWQEALTLGYDRLETAVLGHALVGVNAITIGDTAAGEEEGGVALPGSGIAAGSLTSVQIQVALAVLNRRDAAVRRGGAPKGLRPVTLADAEAALTRALDALARQRLSRMADGGEPA